MAEVKKPQLSKKKVIWGIIAIIVLIAIVTSGGDKKNNTSTKTSTQPSTSQTTKKPESKPTAQPAQRVPQGTATTLGAGTFTGGTDVAVGLYDVTTSSGQSGNFQVNEGAKVNEILGDPSSFGVSKVRMSVAKGDSIKISGLSAVTFTPVTAPFVTEHKTIDLYTGTFKVGEDIGAGAYVVTPGSGESGNFLVNQGSKVNEILGDPSSYGVPSVTVNLAKGDVIELSSLNTATFTAK